jgi:hypothetical protein
MLRLWTLRKWLHIRVICFRAVKCMMSCSWNVSVKAAECFSCKMAICGDLIIWHSSVGGGNTICVTIYWAALHAMTALYESWETTGWTYCEVCIKNFRSILKEIQLVICCSICKRSSLRGVMPDKHKCLFMCTDIGENNVNNVWWFSEHTRIMYVDQFGD